MNERFSIAIVGKSGSGKSFLVKSFLKRLPTPVFVLDRMAEYSGGLVVNRFVEIEQNFIKFPNTAHNKIYIVRALSDSTEKAVFAFAWIIGNCTLILEEADFYTSVYSTDAFVSNLIKRGRHRNVNLILTSQRASELSRLATSQVTLFISFHQNEPRDLENLAKRCGQEFANEVKNLDKYEFVAYGTIPTCLVGTIKPKRILL